MFNFANYLHEEAEIQGKYLKQFEYIEGRTIQFNVRDLEKSNINLGTDEGAETLKKTLGHL